MKSTLVYVSCFLNLISFSILFATKYFVSPTGNDSFDCSLSAPFLTLKHALTLVAAGDFIYLRRGTYPNTATINISVSGSSGNLNKFVSDRLVC